MIIVTYKAGRLANRLFHFSNFIVSSHAHGYKLIYPFFDEYAEYFDYFADKKIKDGNIFLNFTRIKMIDRALKFLVNGCFNYKLNLGRYQFFLGRYNFNLLFFKQISLYKQDRDAIEYDLNSPEIVNNRRRIISLNGWRFRDQINVPRYCDYLKEVFKPKEEYLSRVDEIIATCQEKGDIIIGVHMRRGDYREYCGGDYYFDDQTYLARMKAVQNNFLATGKKCVFLLCSNEPINSASFSEVEFVLGDGHLITDLYSFSQVDYLIGPPSTFTMWASFYGAVPLLFIDKDKKDIALSDFRVITDL